MGQVKWVPDAVHGEDGLLAHGVLTHVGDDGVADDHGGVAAEADDYLRYSHDGHYLRIRAQHKHYY